VAGQYIHRVRFLGFLGLLAPLALAVLAPSCKEHKSPPPLDYAGKPPGAGGFPTGTQSDAGADAAVEPTVLATAQPGPMGIAVSGAYVYFTCVGDGQAGNGSIRRVPKAGGTVEELVTGETAPFALAATPTGFVWTAPMPGVANGFVKKADADGANVTTLASGIAAPSGLAVDGTNVYFPYAIGGGFTVARSLLATPGLVDLGIASAGSTPGGIALSGGFAYVVGGGFLGGLVRVPITGGAVETVYQQASATFVDLILSGSQAIVADDVATKGQLVAISVTSPGNASAVVTDIDRPVRVATDGAWVYFTSFAQSGAVGAYPIAGGTPVVVAENLAFPFGIAVDDAVYVTTETDVLKLPRK
jgi:hypothetical protein